MPNIPLENLNYAENTHNVITSNASATLAIAMVKKYIIDASSSSSSSSSSNDTTVYSLSVKGDQAAEEKVAALIEDYLARPDSSLQPDDIDYLRQQTDPQVALNEDLDKVTLVHDDIVEQWYLPRREIFAAVIAAISDTDESVWPNKNSDDAEQQKIARLKEFDIINHILQQEFAKNQKGICSTGVRHTWIQALHGYAGKELPFGDISIILRTLRAVMIRQLSEHSKVDFLGDKDPSEQQLDALVPLWKNIFLPWLVNGVMPQSMLELLDSGRLRDEIIAAYARIHISPDEKLMKQIDSYVTPDALAELPCDLMPFLATLNTFYVKYSVFFGRELSGSKDRLVREIREWIQKDFFSSPAHNIQTFYRLERLLSILDTLKHHISLDIADIPEIENRNDYLLAQDYFKACQNNPDLSIEQFLTTDNESLLDKHLRHFEQGYQVIKQSLYKGFITNFFSDWFATSNFSSRSQLFKILAELYFSDREAIDNGDKKRIIYLSDNVLQGWLSQPDNDGILDIDIYQINRILLHALNVSVSDWSQLFISSLDSVTKFINLSFNSSEKNLRLRTLRRDAYPDTLLAQIEELKKSVGLSVPEVSQSLMRSTRVLTPLMLSEKTIIIMSYYLAQSHAPLSLIKKIIPADKHSLLNIKTQNKFTPFLIACHFGYVEWVHYFLSELQADINQEAVDKNTALHLSIYSGSLNTVKLLLEKGAVAHLAKLNDAGMAPIHLAVHANHPTIVEHLLKHNFDINLKNGKGFSALHIAAQQNHPTMVDHLLDRGADINLKTDEGFNALHLAVYANKPAMVDHLLKRGADSNLKARNGNSPLHIAVRRNHPTIVDHLLKRGADINLKTDDGFNALHLAVKENNPTMVDYLLDRGADINLKTYDGFNALHLAVQANNPTMVDYLLELGFDINLKTNGGLNALHIAAHANHLTMVNHLLARGFDINLKTDCGQSALHLAVLAKNPIIVNYLIERGVDINLKNDKGFSALHLAVRVNNLTMIDDLLNLGADINLKTDTGLNVLHIAALANNQRMVDYLLERGADSNLKNVKGFSALHQSVYANNLTKDGDTVPNKAFTTSSSEVGLNVAKTLIREDSQIDVQNTQGSSTLHQAIKRKDINAVKNELRLGADVCLKDKDGSNALHIAASVGPTLFKPLLETIKDINSIINQKNNAGDTVLHIAVKSGVNAPFFGYLIEKGADCFIKNQDGDTVLHLIVKHRRNNLLKKITSDSVDINAINREGNTALCIAISDNQSVIAQALTKIGAVISSANKQYIANKKRFRPLIDSSTIGQISANKSSFFQPQPMTISPLHMLVVGGYIERVKACLANSYLDINKLDSEGNTALLLAVKYGHKEIVTVLLEKGANCHLRNNAHQTPLDIAHERNLNDIIDLLENAPPPAKRAKP